VPEIFGYELFTVNCIVNTRNFGVFKRSDRTCISTQHYSPSSVATPMLLFSGALAFVNTVATTHLHQDPKLFLLAPPSPAFLLSQLHSRKHKLQTLRIEYVWNYQGPDECQTVFKIDVRVLVSIHIDKRDTPMRSVTRNWNLYLVSEGLSYLNLELK
jgi:hypothetical protein